MAERGPRHGTARRRTLIAAIATVLLSSVAYAVWVVSDSIAVHDREVEAELRRNADAQAAELDSLLTRWAHLLGSIRALEGIDSTSFDRFVDQALADRGPTGLPSGTFGGMSSVLWVEADGSSAVVRHGRPGGVLEQVEGLDLALLPDRRVALEAARDAGQARTTGFFVPVTEIDLAPPDQSRLASIYVPVYADGVAPATPEARRSALRGWAITGFRADEVLDHISTDSRFATTLLVGGVPVWNSLTGVAAVIPSGPAATAQVTALASDWSVTVEPVAPILARGGLAAHPRLEGLIVIGAGIGLALVLWRIGTSREAALRVADRRRREAVATRRARRHMADRLSIGLIDVDRNGTIRSVNRPGLDLIGVPESGVVGSTLDELLAEAFITDLSISLDARTVDDSEPHSSLLPTTTGRHVRLTRIGDHSGGVLVTLEDVSDHLTEIQELNDSLDAAVEAHDDGQRLLATLSHEIRTPLAGIVGLARTLIDEASPDGPADERIERIERSGADLLRIADDALTATVADARSLTLRPSTVDLRRHIDEVIGDVRARSKSDIEIRLTTIGPVEAVIIDSARLRQIVGNLVENALRHTSTGHVDVDVTLAAEPAALSITVSDTGEGIPNAKLARIFEPFAQIDDSTTRVGGAGLGLSVVRKLADAMGGGVTATSVIGLGSRFRVELPVRLPPPGAPTRERSTAHGSDPDPRCALLVEDDDTTALVTTMTLNRLGFEVERISDGRTAIDTIRGGCAHDLVIVDLHLPRADGFAVIGALERRPGQLVVAATASSQPSDLERCRLLGVDAALQKPVSTEQLTDLLDASATATGADAVSRPEPIDDEQLRRLVDLGIHAEVFDLLDAQIPKIRQDLLTGDADTMRLALHTMSGSMRVLGAGRARERLTEAELHLRDGGDLLDVREEAHDLIRQVIGAVERAEAMVARFD